MPYHTHAQSYVLGLEEYKDALEQFIVDNFVAAAYGGLYNEAADAFPLSALWQTIDIWDAGTVTTPKGVVQDIANNGLILNTVGIYTFNIYLILSYSDSNQGREIELRFWNDTDGAPIGRVIDLFVGRNQAGINFAISTQVEIDDTLTGKLIQMELRTNDSFSNVFIEDAEFSCSHTANYIGPLPESLRG